MTHFFLLPEDFWVGRPVHQRIDNLLFFLRCQSSIPVGRKQWLNKVYYIQKPELITVLNSSWSTGIAFESKDTI